MTDHFNKLTPAELERLALLGEEMGEVQQVVGKILRHGYLGYHPKHPEISARSLLEMELSHVMQAIHLMVYNGDISDKELEWWADQRCKSLSDCLHFNDVPPWSIRGDKAD